MNKALEHLKNNDPVMANLIAHYPAPKLEKHDNYYQQLVSSIIGQQLSVHAAKAIQERFITLFGGKFPSPESVAKMDVETIKSVGLGLSKAKYVQDLAAKIIERTVAFEQFDAMSNQEIVDELTKVKGIGEWTAHMFLMFSMARLDVLPIGDLGVRNAVAKLYGFEKTASPDAVRIVAEENKWHPYETIASLYTWKSLDNIPSNMVP